LSFLAGLLSLSLSVFRFGSFFSSLELWWIVICLYAKIDDSNFFSHLASSKKFELEIYKKNFFLYLGCGFDWQGGITGRISEVSGGS
jgi:hypothetical protein